jgi:hypothetical protein
MLSASVAQYDIADTGPSFGKAKREPAAGKLGSDAIGFGRSASP